MHDPVRRKIALLSHTLPPSPTGQAVAIQRLFGGFAPEECCCLLSREGPPPESGEAGTSCLAPVRFRRIPPGGPASRLPSTLARSASDAFREIRRRGRWLDGILRDERCDILVACSGDFHDIPAARLACRRSGVSLVPYLFDDYAYQWTGPARVVARVLERRAVREAAAVIVPNEGARDAYRARYRIEAAIVRNPCDLPSLAALDGLPRRLPAGTRNVVYAGTVYRAHHDAFRNLVAAMGRLGRDDVRLVVYTSRSADELAAHGISGPFVECRGHIPHPEVPAVLRQADVLFLPLAFRSPLPEVIRTSAPGKMGEYLSAGRPVLVHAPDDAFVCRYFRENGCGEVVGREDPAALADALRRLLEGGEGVRRAAAAARFAAERDFSVGTARAAFGAVLDKVREGRDGDR
jgi:glycosyltransferase involved in cell wall biosynthesis